MSQYRIKLTDLANTYSSAKLFLSKESELDKEVLNKLSELEFEFRDTYISVFDKNIRKIIQFKYTSYMRNEISVPSFLDCYYSAYRAGSSLVNLIATSEIDLEISYRGLCLMYGTALVDDIIDNSLHQENDIILIKPPRSHS